MENEIHFKKLQSAIKYPLWIAKWLYKPRTK